MNCRRCNNTNTAGSKPKIVVLATGGTIAGVGEASQERLEELFLQY